MYRYTRYDVSVVLMIIYETGDFPQLQKLTVINHTSQSHTTILDPPLRFPVSRISGAISSMLHNT